MRKVIVTTGASGWLVSETLTARERDILVMIGQGLSNKRIARVREISPETVKSHVKRIFLKLAVGTRAQAVSQAGSLGLLRGAAILASAIVAIGHAGPVSADPLSVGAGSPATSGEDTLARCQQLAALYDRHNSDGYARPLEARMALEDCRKGNVASGVAALKRALERAQIPVPPEDTATAPGRSMSR